MDYCYGEGVQMCVLCREVVPFLEGSFIGGFTVVYSLEGGWLVSDLNALVSWESCRVE